MKLTVMMFALCMVMMMAACNKPADDTRADAVETQPAPVSETAAPPQDAVEDTVYQRIAGSKLTLASGEEVAVVGVGDFDTRLNELSGLVAIEGRVQKSFPERGALTLVDCDNMAGCADNCCPQAEVPVRLNVDDYEGSFPDTGDFIVVIGDLAVNELGYELAVSEVRSEGEVVLTRKV